MTKYGSWDGWVGRRVVPSGTHPSPAPPRVHPSPTAPVPGTAPGVASVLNVVVGLISVAQLTLGAVFSDIRVMTEVYNLVRIGDR